MTPRAFDGRRVRICVFGAGAVGGYLATRLLTAKVHEVAVIARGEHLRAIASKGLAFESPSERFVVRPHVVTDRPRDLPVQDVVFVTLKAHSQPAAARDIGSLLGASSTAVFVANGIPWWWNHRGEAPGGAPLPLVDTGAALWAQVGPRRAVGCVVYSANEVIRPGFVRHSANNRWLLGEPSGELSARLVTLTRLMCESGLHAEAVADIRRQIWIKLLRNAPLNSLCALTRLPVDELSWDPQLEALSAALIDEISAIAGAEGIDLSGEVDIAKTALGLGAAIDGSKARSIRPSMLQDALNRRSMEVEAILGQVQAFARVTRTPSPVLDILVPLVRGLDRSNRERTDGERTDGERTDGERTDDERTDDERTDDERTDGARA